MKTILDKATRDALIARINTLNDDSTAQWGKMNIHQMMKHCILWEEMLAGKIVCKQAFIGRLFGKMALRSMLKDESPLRRSTPTSPELRVTETDGDVAAEKVKWVSLIEENAQAPNAHFIHPFFGKMTTDEIGYLAYKHIDHHLKQFNS